MPTMLSREEIRSFHGDVVALKLVCDEKDISSDEIVWSVDSDNAKLRDDFKLDEHFPFTNGVLITLMKPGCATVTAEHNGTKYSCKIEIHERLHAESGDELNYYIGDLHDHTCPLNGFDEFAVRTESRPVDYVRQLKEEGLMDFGVISDHSEPLNEKEFFENFLMVENEQPMRTVMFPGCENEVIVIEEDRFGISNKKGGEVVSFNCPDYKESHSWEEFFEKVAGEPFVVCTLAHPQIVGFSVPGVWDFSLNKNNSETLRHAVKMIETGDGSNRQSNLINEFVYSVALDNGFKLSTTCSSDSHGPKWGYHRFPGKTVIMAPERSKEAFLDAIWSNRIYGCESGNIKLRYSVNGVFAPATLTPSDKYFFHVEISYFNEDETTVPVKCQVISDKGRIIKTIENVDFSAFNFEVEAPEASYFFLRFVDSKTRRTWSPPVWTGRPTKGTATKNLIPLDKKGFTATESCGKCADVIVNNDPMDSYTVDGSSVEFIIDMHRTQKVSALGHYPRVIRRTAIKDWYGGTPPILAEFPCEFVISSSTDGVNYERCADGLFRIFGSEEIIEFPEREARFIKLEILSNVGKFKGGEFENANTAFGELTVFKKA